MDNLEDKMTTVAKNAPQQLSEGKCTVNQIREEVELKPIEYDMANTLFSKI